MKPISQLLTFLVLSANLFAQPMPGKLRAHVSFLASDELQGRGTGTEGEKLAANYLVSQFKKLKLKPYGDN